MLANMRNGLFALLLSLSLPCNSGNLFENRQEIIANSEEVSLVTAFDLDSDGDNDLVTAGEEIKIFVNGTSGLVHTHTLVSPLAEGLVINLSYGDIDNDGDEDLIVFQQHKDKYTGGINDGYLPGRLAFYRNNGATQFGIAETIIDISNPILMDNMGVDNPIFTIGDADADGDVDVYIAIRDGSKPFTLCEVIKLINNGQGVFTSEVLVSGEGAGKLLIGNLNYGFNSTTNRTELLFAQREVGESHNNRIIGVSPMDGTYYFFPLRGDSDYFGSPNGLHFFNHANGYYQYITDYHPYSSISKVKIQLLNHYSSNFPSSVLNIYPHRSELSSATELELYNGLKAEYVVGDINNDGNSDLVISCAYCDYFDNQGAQQQGNLGGLRWLDFSGIHYNETIPGWEVGRDQFISNSAENARLLVDLNGDGFLDLITSDRPSNSVKSQGLFWYQNVDVNTSVGENISLEDPAGVDVSFSEVVHSGRTTIVHDTVTPPPDGNFEVLGETYEIQSDSIFLGEIELCFDYDPSNLTADEHFSLRVLHFVNGAWETEENITQWNFVEGQICVLVLSLSPFVLASLKDLDNDGILNLQDLDIDGDGIPNSTEQNVNLDPYSRFDGLEDLDGDGWSNLDEFRFGTGLADTQSNPSSLSGPAHQITFPATSTGQNRFGHSVAIDGNTALIGAYGDSELGTDAGSVYVYTLANGIWTPEAKLTAEDGQAADYFGLSIALSGDTALIGAWGDDDNGIDSGSAYLFQRSNGQWSQSAKLTASDGVAEDWFGWSVSIDGNTALISALGDDEQGNESGSAYLFQYSNGQWIEHAKLVASDGAANDEFSYDVVLDGDNALISAYRDDDNGTDSGSVYAYKYSNGSWEFDSKFTATDNAPEDRFGFSIDLDGNSAVVSAYWDDDSGSASGSAYVFVYENGAWVQQAKLTASDGGAQQLFGFSVAIENHSVLVSAIRDDDQGSGSGSVYLFSRDNTTWTQTTKILPANGNASAYFGYALDLNNATGLVGRQNELDFSEAYFFNLSNTITSNSGEQNDIPFMPAWAYLLAVSLISYLSQILKKPSKHIPNKSGF